MISSLRIPVLMLAVVFAAALGAHQQKESITRVLFNERTGNIEVMHRFLLHDAEHACRELFGRSADLLSSSEDRDRFARYVYGHFSMADQGGESIRLTPVGNEIEGRFLWVYAEAPIPERLEELTLSHQALRDVWPGQVNMVNVERDRQVRTATFRDGSSEITIEL